MTTLKLKHSFWYDQKWGKSGLALLVGFPAWLPMGCLARWNCFTKLSDCYAALSLYWIVASVSLLQLTAPPFSPHFLPFKKDNDNGFYLMFFLLSHFPICSPICQCHLLLRLSECSFTPANRVVLTTDDDVDRGDGLHECKFIYVAIFHHTALKFLNICNVTKHPIHVGPQSLMHVGYLSWSSPVLRFAHCVAADIVHYKPSLKPHIYFLFLVNEQLVSPLLPVCLV